MAPVNKGKVFTCRKKMCSKIFTDRSNRDRHEQRLNHKVAKRRCKQPLFDEKEKKYHCVTRGCSKNSKFKDNIVRHMKDCVQKQLRKEQKAGIKVCQYCGKTFVQKSNRDHHVRNQHEDGTFDHTNANETVDEGVVPLTFVPEFEPVNQPGTSNQQSNADADIDSNPHQTNPSEILNVSFLSNDGNIIDAIMAEIEQETHIYEVFEPSLNIALPPIREDNAKPTESTSLLHTTLKKGEELIRMVEQRETTFENSFKEKCF